MFVSHIWIIVNLCFEAKSNNSLTPEVGPSELGNCLVSSEGAVIRVMYSGEESLEARGTNYTFVLFLLSKMEAPFCAWRPSSLQVSAEQQQQHDFQIPPREISTSEGDEGDPVHSHAWPVCAALISSSWVRERAWWSRPHYLFPALQFPNSCYCPVWNHCSLIRTAQGANMNDPQSP